MESPFTLIIIQCLLHFSLYTQEEDLESEFDPAEHDKRMREIFDEQYYGDADDTKPVFPDLDDELEIGE